MSPAGEPRFSPEAERETFARTLAFLFGFGGVLLLFTLLLPGGDGRDEIALAAIAVAALIAAGGLMTAFHRLPMGLLALAPALGSILTGAVICFAGPEASAAYALYFAWVVIAAANYLTRTMTALHGAFAVIVYAVAIEIVGPGPAPAGLRVAMLAGTAVVASVVMAGLAMRARAFVAQLEDDVRTDPLTGLDNRRALQEATEREFARADRSRRPLALIVLDLDHFKEFNDELGHLAGDQALRRLARILDEITRVIEATARLGGDEFAIVVPETDEAGARALAERLRIAVASEFAGAEPRLTISCGIAVHRPEARGAVDLFEAADRALYAAKEAGRNRVSVARPELALAGASDQLGDSSSRAKRTK
jgi:diguanylate cyclase (GGDEF)-like protein